jgi:eukaryotic-like serine/threonine-protein kinase
MGALGRYRDKLEVGQQSLALCKAKLGRDHVLTIWTMQDLADSYYLLGRHAEALKLRQETLALRKAKVGPGDPDTLLTICKYGSGPDCSPS